MSNHFLAENEKDIIELNITNIPIYYKDGTLKSFYKKWEAVTSQNSFGLTPIQFDILLDQNKNFIKTLTKEYIRITKNNKIKTAINYSYKF